MEVGSMRAAGVVEAVSNKTVNTKYGPKPTYSAKVGGQWFKFGFKNPNLNDGDAVEFDYTPGTYGNEANIGSLTKSVVTITGGGGSGGGSGATAVVLGGPRPAPSYGSKGVFPIPALDGQRSIVRQNALTNAREVFVAAHGGKMFSLDINTDAQAVIELAKKFEAYTAGDLDMAEAKASIAAEEATKH
jgi:hypothetical protein